MTNDPETSLTKARLQARQLASSDGAAWGGSRAALDRIAAAPYVVPLLYVAAAASGNRGFLAVLVTMTALGYFASGRDLFAPDHSDDEPVRGSAMWTALGWQAAGLAPWLVLPLIWSSLSTPRLTLALPLLAAWGMAGLLLSDGKGATLWARGRTSRYGLLVVISGGLWAFALLIVGLILLIKASHPLR